MIAYETAPARVSPDFSPSRIAPFLPALLAANGAVLAATGFAQLLFTLASALLGSGPLGTLFTQSHFAIGFVEAYGFAILVGLLLIRHRREATPAWHVLAAATHLLLGGTNLLFWSDFAANDLIVAGLIATALHAAFLVFETGAALVRAPWVVTGPGALFRVSAGLTLLTGIGLHLSSLPLGREAFVSSVFTPLVDVAFAIPMSVATLTAVALWRRAELGTVWRKVVYAAMVLVFAVSMVIHLRTLFTWDTSYVALFPDWYPLAATAYLGGLFVFAITQRFRQRA